MVLLLRCPGNTASQATHWDTPYCTDYELDLPNTTRGHAPKERKKEDEDELVERGVAYRKIKQLIIKIHEQEDEVSYMTSCHSHSNRDVGTKFFNQNTMSMWTGLGIEEEYDIALEYKSRFCTVH